MRYILNTLSIAGTLAAVIVSQNIFQWIHFLPSTIPYTYLLYALAVSILLGPILSYIIEPKHSKGKKRWQQITTLARRWGKYNLFASIMVFAWSMYISIKLGISILHLLTGYGLVVFIALNSILLISSCFISEDIHVFLDVLLIVSATTGSILLCNIYLTNYFTDVIASQTPYLVFGAVVSGIIASLMIQLAKAANGSVTGAQELFSTNNFILLVATSAVFTSIGIGIYYNAETFGPMEILIPIAIISGMLFVNFIAANNFIGKAEIKTYQNNNKQPGNNNAVASPGNNNAVASPGNNNAVAIPGNTATEPEEKPNTYRPNSK